MAKISSTKRALIDRANTNVVVLTSVAAFILVFCGVATKTLISQAAYQNRVISANKATLKQVKSNINAVTALKKSYQEFSNADTNVLGGSKDGNGPLDGANSKLVLDALPRSYDFPALATSLEKLLASQKVSITNIGGTDEETTQSSNNSSNTPTPVPMPFQLTVTGNYDSIRGLVGTFEKSIRPIQIQTLDITGDSSQLDMTITAQTFYQPAKTFSMKSEVIK